MPAKQTAPYGAWKSPVTTGRVTAGGLRLGEIRTDGPRVYALEGRPAEGGRSVIVRLSGGAAADVTPEGFNVRNRVHEYGGGSYAVRGGTVYFSNWTDQRIYRQPSRGKPVPITPEPATPHGYRFADLTVSPDGEWVVCIRERHKKGREAVNEVVAVPAAGGTPKVLASGHDFYSSARVSPDGTQVCWMSWDHPNMPWDGAGLWTARVDSRMRARRPEKAAGGESESIFQPEWSPDGVLHFISDRTGWWNLYAWSDGVTLPLAPMSGECGSPQWVFGLSTYAFLSDGRISLAHGSPDGDRVSLIGRDGSVADLDLPYRSIGSLRASGRTLYFNGASPSLAPEVVKLDAGTGKKTVLRKSAQSTVAARYFSVPEAVSFPTGPVKGRRPRDKSTQAHALFYPPVNPDFSPSRGEKPPLIVISHGGPTSSAGSSLSLAIQFWTTRGFGVADVNYRGSAGYGRKYRDALRGVWGIADVEDCVAAARHLVAQGRADGDRLIIRGGSAGGYTTLCALVFTDVFAAGASYYGVADAESLATDTHKFESRYLDGLIGPYPAARKTYRERSPIDYVDRVSCPVIIFQGLEDEIVPPSQAEAMVAALRAKRLPFAYVPFEGEQHGFRKAENIERSLEAELYFYGRVFSFKPADRIKPVEIENL